MNLVFIFADQLQAAALGCTGNPDVQTPNIDALAAEGVTFANSVSCFPVCTPFRASLISGRYPHSIDVMDNDVPLPLNGQGFGYALKGSKMATGWIGKWHLLGSMQHRSTFIPPGIHRHGFDDYWAGLNCTHDYINGCEYINSSPVMQKFEGYRPDVEADHAIKFIKKNKGAPFALFWSAGTPHDPYHTVPEKWKKLYDVESLTFRPNVFEDVPMEVNCSPGNAPDTNEHHTYFERVYGAYSNDPEVRRRPNKMVLRDYYAAITNLDWNVGRIMEALKSEGVADETIVVFTADHGDMMYSHGLTQKNYPWDESVLVPFIMRCPKKINKGQQCSSPFNTVDIMPTILDLLGIDIPPYCEGVSFAPAVLNMAQKLPDCAYIMNAWPWAIPEWRGIRTQKYTYAEFADGPALMYDNQLDPYQLVNLINLPEYASLQQSLQLMYQEKQSAIGDNFEKWQSISKRMQAKREEWEAAFGEDLLM